VASNSIDVHHKKAEPWTVTLIDTGESTQTGGRLKRVKDYLDGDFCMTYGDGVGSIDIGSLISFHRSHGRLATMTAVQPPGRFGALKMDGNRVDSFVEKPQGDGGKINGGFFVLNPKVLDFIEMDQTSWEGRPLELLAAMGELHAFSHQGFWQPMDTIRDKAYLEELWASGEAPWKLWA
jgi:glucose-1-phosphate cytidylyltransferase